MDEGTLNDLLECSVCLERLDTSSKVLPCQHTFCKKCLEEIVERHKELRCPECRVLVPSKVDELPPNVLLMRLLEGMRNATPKTQHRSAKTVASNSPHIVQQTTPVHQHLSGNTEHRLNSNKQTPPPHPVQPYAKALYDYVSKTQGDLSFKRGDIILLRKRIDNHWYQGECGGNQGVFPLCYVQIITPVPSHTPQCKALYDFKMTNDEEEGCLSFSKGDIISVIRRVDENWAEGKLNGRIGIFPLAFVELNSLARSLMKLSTNAQPGPSKVAPPTPTADDSIPLIPTDHSRTIANIHLSQQHAPPPPTHARAQAGLQTSDSSSTVSSGSSSTTTPNTSSSTTSSGSSTAPSSPASPPPRTQGAGNRPVVQKAELHTSSNTSNTPQQSIPTPRQDTQHNREKRHSFTSVTLQPCKTNTHRHSAEILGSESEIQSQAHSGDHSRKNGSDKSPGVVQLPAAYVALYPYKPHKPDELELRKGGIYMVTERCQDGWFKGTSNRTQKCGVFPGNYVTLARSGLRHAQGSRSTETNDKTPTNSGRNNRNGSSSSVPPELPPRSGSPSVTSTTISSSWHGQQDAVCFPLGRSSSAIVPVQQLVGNGTGKPSDKSKERREKGTVSLMRRLTSIKRSKSPPPSYSMDNPVFEDSSVSMSAVHPVHVRSGSCPSQLLQMQPTEHHRIFASTSQRLKHKERPSVLTHSPRVGENPPGGPVLNPEVHHHRKSNSLDAGNRTKTGTQTVRERFRCIAPYPPNSEYELELQVNDIIYVHKKRDDGWYKGTQQRTGRTGLFPASFVESF